MWCRKRGREREGSNRNIAKHPVLTRFFMMIFHKWNALFNRPHEWKMCCELLLCEFTRADTGINVVKIMSNSAEHLPFVYPMKKKLPWTQRMSERQRDREKETCMQPINISCKLSKFVKNTHNSVSQWFSDSVVAWGKCHSNEKQRA